MRVIVSLYEGTLTADAAGTQERSGFTMHDATRKSRRVG